MPEPASDARHRSAGDPSTPAPGLDRAAVARLWDENRGWVAAVIAAHKPAGTDLEDLLQDVAATLVSRAHTIRDEAAARGWLRVVAVNAARAAGRRVTRRGEHRRQTIDEAGPVFAGHADPAEPAMERELRQRLHALPETYREPLMLRAVRGLPATVIGEVLGLTEAAVNTRLARARRMLRGTLPDRPNASVAETPPPLARSFEPPGPATVPVPSARPPRSARPEDLR